VQWEKDPGADRARPKDYAGARRRAESELPTVPPVVCPGVEDAASHAIFFATIAGDGPINVTGACESTYGGTPHRVCNPDGTWSATQFPCTGAHQLPQGWRHAALA